MPSLWGLLCKRLDWARGALGLQEGTEQTGSGALHLLGLLLSQGERGETGPPGPAGFAGPPVSTPSTLPATPSTQASPHLAPEGSLQPVGEEGTEFKEERNGLFPPSSPFICPHLYSNPI